MCVIERQPNTKWSSDLLKLGKKAKNCGIIAAVTTKTCRRGRRRHHHLSTLTNKQANKQTKDRRNRLMPPHSTSVSATELKDE